MNSIKPAFGILLKSFIEYFLTVLCLILLIPVIVILATVIKVSDNGPVIYKQRRIGRHGKSFFIYKFRSMHIGTGDGVPLLTGRNDKRITPVGRFMRKHKFDEIPNLVNVLKGEMSLVGPRPEQEYFIHQIALAAPEYKLLHNIKPGITSWGQVKYGYASDVSQMIKRLSYDLYYLEHKSLMFDLNIAALTVAIIIKGEGV